MSSKSSRQHEVKEGHDMFALRHRKRAFHARTRTGCITCKVRCDEQKPSCNRCVSTGRKCDRYAHLNSPELSSQTPTNQTSSAIPTQRHDVSIPTSLGLPLPRRNDQELRSYRFFLDVTASAFAGVFDVDFWLTDIPRTCHSDPAIWHAVVSLGAAHEGYLATREAAFADTTKPFALHQYNQAVKHLVHLPSSRTVPEERWRALIASVLFTYLCSIQGLHSQSGVHLAAAKSLLKELQCASPGQSLLDPTQANQSKTPVYLKTSSVSYQAVLSVIGGLELQSQALHSRGTNEAPELLRDVDVYNAWRYYTAPTPRESSKICQHGRCVPSRATPENLACAGGAFQSLLDALILLSQRIQPDKAGAPNSVGVAPMENPVSRQKPYIRAFRELDTALNMLISDTSGGCLCFAPTTALLPDQLTSSVPTFLAMQHRNKAINSLRVFRETCYPLIYGAPTLRPTSPTGDPLDPHADFIAYTIRLLDMADSVLKNEATHRRFSAAEFIPTLSITQPIFVAAANAPTLALRRRAIALLRKYPRREGLWDSLFVAGLLEACLDQEVALVRETVEGVMAGQVEIGEVVAIPASCQVRWAVVSFTGAHTACVTMQTLAEWLADEPGREVPLRW